MKRGLTLSDEQINLRSSRRRTHYLLRSLHSCRQPYDERGLAPLQKEEVTKEFHL
jgi:hypothetical protein